MAKGDLDGVEDYLARGSSSIGMPWLLTVRHEAPPGLTLHAVIYIAAKAAEMKESNNEA